MSTPYQKVGGSFLKDQESLLRERTSIILLMGCILMPLFGLLDYILYPEYIPRFMAYRVIAATSCAVLYIINQKWNLGQRSFYLGTAAYYIVGMSIIKMIVDAGGYATPYYAGLTLVFVGFSAVLTVGFRQFALHSVILYAIYVAMVILSNEPQEVNLFVGNNMFLSATLIIVLVAAAANHRLRFKEYVTRSELKEVQAQLERYSRSLENTAAASEAKYRHVVENANEAIIIYQDDRPKFFNTKALDIFGYAAGEYAGLSFMETVHQDDRPLILERHRKRLGGEKVAQLYEFRVLDKSGSVKWLQTSDVVVDWEGRPATLALMNDITESVMARLEIKQLEEQLLQSQKLEAIGRLAGGVAHDFNNILQGISGYVQLLLLKRDDTDSYYSSLAEIDASVERATQLIQQLLAFGRRIERKPKPVDPNQEVLQACRLLERTIPKMISIETRLAGKLKQVIADPTQLNQIIMNLGSNASHAMPEGGRLIIETKNVRLDEAYCRTDPELIPGDYVLLRVSDTGEGMTKETVEHVFEPFYTTKEVGQGTGLGLATVYGIVKAHGGHITCYSELGLGTTFNIYLPVLETGGLKPIVIRKKPEKIRGGTETILVVDDEKSVLETVQDALKLSGYAPITANSGEEALEVYEENPGRIDLIILDLGMPGMGGRKCLAELLKIDSKVRILISSGYSANGLVKDTLESGARGFIGKPYRLVDMLKKVREILDEK